MNNNSLRRAFKQHISVVKELKNKEEKESLAERLLEYEIFPSDLTDKETDDMIEFFIKDIQEKDKELEKIKKHIIEMKKKLEVKNNKK